MRRSRATQPARSVSTHQLPQHRLRPIGLSKSDDEILNKASESPEEDDYMEDYKEGQEARDLSADLHTFHMHDDDYFKNTDHHAANPGNVEPKLPTLSSCYKKNNDGKSNLSKSQALPARLPLRPLELHTPPGTAPLP